MIKGASIVCIPLVPWESESTNTLVQLMKILSRENKILFIDYPFSIKDALLGWSGKRPVPYQRMLGMGERLRQATREESIYLLTLPPVLPINWIKWRSLYRIMLQLNSRLIQNSIQAALITQEMENPIVINGNNPFLGLPMAGKLDEVLNIYFCYNEIKEDTFYAFHGPEIEKAYVKRTDGIIVTSDALLESKCTLHNNCYLVKSEVEPKLFASITDVDEKETWSQKAEELSDAIEALRIKKYILK